MEEGAGRGLRKRGRRRGIDVLWVHWEYVYCTKQHLVRRILQGLGTKLYYSANLLSDLIGHGLMKVLELHTQSKVSQLDGAIG